MKHWPGRSQQWELASMSHVVWSGERGDSRPSAALSLSRSLPFILCSHAFVCIFIKQPVSLPSFLSLSSFSVCTFICMWVLVYARVCMYMWNWEDKPRCHCWGARNLSLLWSNTWQEVTQGWKALSWLMVLGDIVSGKGMCGIMKPQVPFLRQSAANRVMDAWAPLLSLLLFVQFLAPAYWATRG